MTQKLIQKLELAINDFLPFMIFLFVSLLDGLKFLVELKKKLEISRFKNQCC